MVPFAAEYFAGVAFDCGNRLRCVRDVPEAEGAVTSCGEDLCLHGFVEADVVGRVRRLKLPEHLYSHWVDLKQNSKLFVRYLHRE